MHTYTHIDTTPRLLLLWLPGVQWLHIPGFYPLLFHLFVFRSWALQLHELPQMWIRPGYLSAADSLGRSRSLGSSWLSCPSPTAAWAPPHLLSLQAPGSLPSLGVSTHEEPWSEKPRTAHPASVSSVWGHRAGSLERLVYIVSSFALSWWAPLAVSWPLLSAVLAYELSTCGFHFYFTPR